LAFIVRIYHNAQSSECQILNNVYCVKLKKRNLTVSHRMDVPPPSGGLQYNTLTIHWQNLQSSIKHWSSSPSLRL